MQPKKKFPEFGFWKSLCPPGRPSVKCIAAHLGFAESTIKGYRCGDRGFSGWHKLLELEQPNEAREFALRMARGEPLVMEPPNTKAPETHPKGIETEAVTSEDSPSRKLIPVTIRELVALEDEVGEFEFPPIPSALQEDIQCVYLSAMTYDGRAPRACLSFLLSRVYLDEHRERALCGPENLLERASDALKCTLPQGSGAYNQHAWDLAHKRLQDVAKDLAYEFQQRKNWFDCCSSRLDEIRERIETSDAKEPPLTELLTERIKASPEAKEFFSDFGAELIDLEPSKGNTWPKLLDAARRQFRGAMLLELEALERKSRWRVVAPYWLPLGDYEPPNLVEELLIGLGYTSNEIAQIRCELENQQILEVYA
jgi:hypothetical protein